MPYYYIWTIGCQMNKSESERLGSALEFQGYLLTEKVEKAELVIINSCVVRESAENRVINKLHAIKSLKHHNPNLRIAVTGCLVDENTERLKTVYPFVDYFFKAGDFPSWVGQIDPENILPKNPKVACYIPIMQGCNNFCTYCIVPYRRGREKSRALQDIVSEVKYLVSKGVKEVTLLGQNVNSYGRDLSGQPDLADLLVEINSLDGLERIRFLTNHPKDMQDKLIQTMTELKKVCEQINIPVQSGDDDILKAMNRGYRVDQYRKTIQDIRRSIPNISLSTDVIAGFPGETESQFEHTLDLLNEIHFDMVHVAAYSPRSGTPAARLLKDDIPASIKKKRVEAVEKLQTRIAGEINAQLVGAKVEILVEGFEKGKWFGRTRGDKLVFFVSEQDFQSQILNIKILHSSPWSLSGSI
jgi:tRNA-2-methylthio-N6-dimethylallyladenosine synthase